MTYRSTIPAILVPEDTIEFPNGASITFKRDTGGRILVIIRSENGDFKIKRTKVYTPPDVA